MIYKVFFSLYPPINIGFTGVRHQKFLLDFQISNLQYINKLQMTFFMTSENCIDIFYPNHRIPELRYNFDSPPSYLSIAVLIIYNASINIILFSQQ